jgi:hypothetical protein
MDEVKILIQGHARRKPDGRWDATSATVLVRSAGKFVLIDPGVNSFTFNKRASKRGLDSG